MILAVLSGSRGTLMPFIIVLLLLLLAMGIYRSPAVSLMPDLTPSPVRSRANAVINLMLFAVSQANLVMAIPAFFVGWYLSLITLKYHSIKPAVQVHIALSLFLCLMDIAPESMDSAAVKNAISGSTFGVLVCPEMITVRR